MKCDASSASLLDCGHWSLWVFSIICVILIAYYTYHLIITVKMLKTVKIGDLINPIIFWTCLILNPLLCFIQFLKFNLVSAPIARYIFIVLQPFCVYLPFVLISQMIISFVSTFSSGKYPSRRWRSKFVSSALYFYIAVFIGGTIAAICSSSINLFIVLDLIAVVLHVVGVVIFIYTCVLSLISLSEQDISGLPKRFFGGLTIGLDLISLIEFGFLFWQLAMSWWSEFSQVTYRESMTLEPGWTLIQHSLYKLVGSLLPSFILAVGVAYINKVPEQSTLILSTTSLVL